MGEVGGIVEVDDVGDVDEMAGFEDEASMTVGLIAAKLRRVWSSSSNTFGSGCRERGLNSRCL